MLWCRLCLAETVDDDIAFRYAVAGCLCLRCNTRLTGTGRALSAELRRALRAIGVAA